MLSADINMVNDLDKETNTKNVDALPYLFFPYPVGKMRLFHRGPALLELAVTRHL